MTPEFKADERRWVRLKWEQIRMAQRKADAANLEWQSLNDSLESYLDRSKITDMVQRVNIKNESIALNDALATGDWHSRNAERHIHDLQLFIKMKEVGLL